MMTSLNPSRHFNAFNILKERLQPIQKMGHAPPGTNGAGIGVDDDDATFVDPVPCGTFDELKKHYFPPTPPLLPGQELPEVILGLEHTAEIEYTLATMLATVLSTTTSGGQLGIRVCGVPGTAKSILSECISCCRELVYPKSKFTGLVSGWASVRKSQIMAEKANGKCVLIKDADTMLQLPNLAIVESEIRDAMGDGVIRADYRTGREFEIYTLFSMILCGTIQLKLMDDALLGARFLDCFIQKFGADTSKIVRRAIKSQSQQICSQLSGEREEKEDKKPDKIKPIVRKLGGPTVGFLLQKKMELEKRKIKMIPLSPAVEQATQSMADLVALLRMKPKRDFNRELKFRPQKENPTRLGEQFTRLQHYLSIVFWDGKSDRCEVGDREIDLSRKILHDTCWSFETDVVNTLYHNPAGGDVLDIAESANLSRTKAYELCENLLETGVVVERKVPNIHGRRGRQNKLYCLSDQARYLCNQARF